MHIFWHVWHMLHKTNDFSAYTLFAKCSILFGFLAHFLTCLTHLSQNMWFQLLHIRMFQKHVLLWFTHYWHNVLFLHGFFTFSDMFDTCFRKHVILLAHVSESMCFYLGFVHIVDNMRNATLVFTRFTMVFHIFRNMSFYMGFVHMIDNMCNFALVLHMLCHFWCIFQTTCNLTWVLVHIIDNMCNST